MIDRMRMRLSGKSRRQAAGWGCGPRAHAVIDRAACAPVVDSVLERAVLVARETAAAPRRVLTNRGLHDRSWQTAKAAFVPFLARVSTPAPKRAAEEPAGTKLLWPNPM